MGDCRYNVFVTHMIELFHLYIKGRPDKGFQLFRVCFVDAGKRKAVLHGLHNARGGFGNGTVQVEEKNRIGFHNVLSGYSELVSW